MYEALEREVALDLQERGIGVFATATPASRNIYVGELPQGVEEGILLIAVASPPPHQYIDHEYTVIDFWVRSPHTDRAHDLIRQIYNLLHRRHHWQTANWYIYFSQALGSIEDVDRDTEGGKLYRLSVQFICRNINNVS